MFFNFYDMDLTYAIVEIEGIKRLNHTKITKEDAFEIIKQNSLQVIEESQEVELSDECFFPQNFDVIKALLNYDGVYASPDETYEHFQDEAYINTFPVSTMRSGNPDGIYQDVKKYLSRGLAVYIHSYYIMEIDRHIDDELTVQEPWYWYRMGIVKK